MDPFESRRNELRTMDPDSDHAPVNGGSHVCEATNCQRAIRLGGCQVHPAMRYPPRADAFLVRSRPSTTNAMEPTSAPTSSSKNIIKPPTISLRS